MAKKAARKKPTTKRSTEKAASKPVKKASKVAARATKGKASSKLGQGKARGAKASQPAAKAGARSLKKTRGKALAAVSLRKAPESARPTRPAKAPRPTASPASVAPRAAETPLAAPAIEAKPAPVKAPIAIVQLGPPAKTPDIATVIQKSRMFFAGNRLAALAGAIPAASEFPDSARGALARAASLGFDEAFAFPPVAAQRQSLDHIINRLAEAGSDSLPAEHQYAQPWVYQPERFRDIATSLRPETPYILCLRSAPMPSETRNLDASELREWLEAHAYTSLTPLEYLILQRWRAEQNADHRFDTVGGDAPQTHWLLDMRSGDGPEARFATGSWNPKLRRVELGWCSLSDTSPRKGAQPTIVIPATISTPAALAATTP